MNLEADLNQRLAEVEAQGLRRSCRILESAQGPEVLWEGKRFLNFSSNDYLGLAAHPRLKEAARQALDRYGVGAGASRLVCGSLELQHDLETALAAWKGTQGALTFSTGYATGLGVIPALVGPEDLVILDKLSHASLIDGARLSGAKMRLFPHQNLDYLETILKRRTGSKRTLIVTESVFSMDGDVAPLKELVELKERYGAWLLVDEAHAAGLYGSKRAGLVQELGLSHQVEVQLGTLSKALGSAGGYIAGSKTLVDFLINKSRSFIYSTAPAPAVSAASLAAVQLVAGSEGQGLAQKLWQNVRMLVSALVGGANKEHPSAIFPWIVGNEEAALEAAERLRVQGFLVPAIRYPTVAKGKARLRITVSAAHAKEQIEALAKAIHEGQGP